jgi:hypothetical protein
VALAGVAVYPFAATDRLVAVIGAVGALALALFAAALVWRVPALAAWGIAGCGTEYGLFLGFRGGTIDRWAPLVAAALFLTAELGYRAVERPEPAPEREIAVRSALWLVAYVLGAAVVGSILLDVAGRGHTGLGLEAAGAAAAVAVLAIVVAVVFRAARSRDS